VVRGRGNGDLYARKKRSEADDERREDLAAGHLTASGPTTASDFPVSPGLSLRALPKSVASARGLRLFDLPLSIRGRMAALVLILMLPVAVVVAIIGEQTQQHAIEEAERLVLTVAKIGADHNRSMITNATRTVASIANDASWLPLDEQACRRVLAERAASLGWRAPVMVFDQAGSLLCSSVEQQRAFDVESEFLADVLATPDVQIDDFRNDQYDLTHAIVGGRASLSDGRKAIVLTTLELTELRERLAGIIGTTTYKTMIVDRRGIVLARAPESAGPVGVALRENHPLLPTLRIAISGTASGRSNDGVDRIFAFTQLPETGAKLVVGLVRAEVVAEQEQAFRKLMLLLVAVGLAATAAFAMGGEAWVARQVRALTQTAAALREGDLSARADATRMRGEFRTLALTLNEMAAKLRLRQEEAEMRALELAASEQRFRDVAEVAGDWIWERDRDRNLTYVSERFAEVNGFGWVTGEMLDEAIRRGAEAASLDEIRRAMAARQPFRNVILCVRVDDQVRYWAVSGKPVFDANGEFCGYRGAGSDVTVAKLAEVELVAAKDLAEHTSRVKSEFIATMTHELRTPLHATIGFAELLRDSLPSADERADYAAAILDSGRQLLAVVENVLDYARAEADTLAIGSDPFDLAATTRKLARRFEAQIEAAGLHLSFRDSDALIIVLGDERRVEQVLMQVMSNAVKFTPRGGSITLATGMTAQEGWISVRDTGVGMSTAEIAATGQPFWQADGALGRNREGIGLGLALSIRLMNLQNGTLQLASEPGAGTEVTITVPR
jgi:PAS domain S-box-containing protein